MGRARDTASAESRIISPKKGTVISLPVSLENTDGVQTPVTEKASELDYSILPVHKRDRFPRVETHGEVSLDARADTPNGKEKRSA